MYTFVLIFLFYNLISLLNLYIYIKLIIQLYSIFPKISSIVSFKNNHKVIYKILFNLFEKLKNNNNNININNINKSINKLYLFIIN